VKVQLLSVGRPRDAALAAAIGEYEGRAARYWPLESVEVREEPGRSLAPDEVRRREGERLLERCGPSAHVVACDERGALMDSRRFAQFLQEARERAQDVAFVIGGAHGLHEQVRSRARTTLAFCSWTLPHELARLVLAEQLYRAGTIVRGEPYHK
jgi:23S rRNA (pseudouridine1915-N3)-methyltransferase